MTFRMRSPISYCFDNLFNDTLKPADYFNLQKRIKMISLKQPFSPLSPRLKIIPKGLRS